MERLSANLLLFFLAVLKPAGGSFPGGDCIEPCIAEMQQTEQMGQLSLSALIGASSDKDVTEKSFQDICQAYGRVDLCLHGCEKVSQHSASIRKTYAGIRFICVEHRDALTRHEKVALERCRPEINASLSASNRFSVTVLKKEHHNLRSHFETLCKKLGSMIDCVEPVTRIGCGDQAARMMLRFITVGFSSFEQLYSQLGISDQLPAACKSLLSLQRRTALSHERSHFVVPHPKSEYSVYGSNQSSRLSIFFLFLILTLKILA
ncbi:unnamed protein product [Caenorhabditis auriculariae]|uniref:Chondroitin proteoglycan 4 domain-containing protein n=1 Tax=Caenorhabditis auriculariae TaxID=2777116 RepID=A0A8S1HGZ4_9PELO|nr:unnamed protein product [Caenorhabditis auriculariae]